MADRNANIVISLRSPATPELRSLVDANLDLIASLQKTGSTVAQAERQLLSLAQAEARARAAAGDLSGSERTLEGALVVITKESTAAYSAQTQLAGVQKRMAADTSQAKASTVGLSQSLGGLQSALGTLGIAVGVKQVVDFGVSSAQAALELRETKNALRAVAGDAKTYSTIIASAREQQLLFGGSLQENIEGLSGLAVTSRNTGAQLSTLIDLQKRLTVLNPAQGAQGGLIALNEALAGNVSSLQRRFNIPRAALQALSDTSKPVAERLKVIDEFLNHVGITSAAVAGKVDQDALAFRRLSQELGDLRTGAGDALASSFAGAATGLSRLIGLINGNPQAIAELKAILSGKGGVDQAAIDQAAQDVARSRASRALSGSAAAPQQAQFNINRLGGAANAEPVIQQLAKLEQAGGDVQRRAEQLAVAFASGKIGADALRIGLNALTKESVNLATGTLAADDAEQRRVNILNAARDAANAAAQAIRDQAKEIDASAQKSIVDASAKNAQQAKTALLQAQTQQAVDAFRQLNPNIDAAGVASLVAAGKIPVLVGQMLALQVQTDQATGALGRLNLAAGIAAGAANLDKSRFALGGASGTNASVLAGLAKGQSVAEAQIGRENQLHDLQLQNRLDNAKTSAERIAILKQELAGTTDLLERQRLQNQIDQERNSAAKHHTSELNKQLNLEERIRDSKEAQFKASLDIQKLTAQDVLDRLKEAREARTANNILNSSRASAEFKQAAAARLSIIDADQKLRALDIAEKQKTVGGTIINGRVFQSRPAAGGAPVPSVPTPGGAGAPQVPSVPTPGGAGGGGAVTINLNVNGHTIATEIIPDVLQALRSGQRQANSAGGGTG